VLVDVDRVHFVVQGSGARLRIAATRDGEPLPASQYRIGAASSGPATLPESLALGSTQLAFGGTSHAVQRNPGVRCAIYEVAGFEAEKATIDSALEERLRALGYLGD